jgi:dipeptidase E
MVKIIAIGGGENGRPGTKYETKQIDEEIVKLSGKKHPKVLFIPPPSQFQESYFQVMQKVFVKLGCEISPLYLSDPKPKKRELENTILGSDIIYVGGGNTLKMLKYWRKHGIDKILQKAAKQDTVLSGLSAGAICWFRSGCSDSQKFTNPDAGLIKIKALDYVPALYCPHYDAEADRKPDLEKVMRRTTEIGLAFDNCSAIEIVDDKYRIITSNKQANAYRTYWKNGQYHEEIIEKKKTFSPLDELLSK